MTRILITVAIVLAFAGAGTYYVIHRNDVAVTATTPAVPEQTASNPTAADRKSEDEALRQKRLAGIGSVKKLKPVELGPTIEQEARAHKH
jgi:hypothetical protein